VSATDLRLLPPEWARRSPRPEARVAALPQHRYATAYIALLTAFYVDNGPDARGGTCSQRGLLVPARRNRLLLRLHHHQLHEPIH